MKFQPLLLLIISTYTLSCSQFSKNSEDNINREIAAERNCHELLDHFLPKNERFNEEEALVKVTSGNQMRSSLNKSIQSLNNETESEASDLFNSFTKETKSLATKASFKLVVDPQEALLTRVMMIRNAKKSIDMTYYIFQDSDTSGILINELRAALRRGVDIKVMVDGTGSLKASLNFYKELNVLNETVAGNILDESGNFVRKAKFEAVVINPIFNVRATIKNWYAKITKLISNKDLPADDFAIFHRSHDKILLIDAEDPEKATAIIGGRNISNHYYEIGSEAERDSSFNDLDILVKNFTKVETKDGKDYVYNSLLEHFNRLYFYSANKKFNDFLFKYSRNSLSTKLKGIRHTKNELISKEGTELNLLLDEMNKKDYLNSGFDEGYVSFLNEIGNLIRKNPFRDFDFSNNKNSIVTHMWQQMLKAEKDILICSPYIYFTTEEIDFFVKWLKENPERKFRLITNSSATSDNIFAQSIVENFVIPKLMKRLKEEKIPEKQFEISAYGNLNNKEFGGKERQGKLHAKFWMVDNYSVTTGTDNLDPVSRYFNSEVVANVFPVNENSLTVKQLNDYYTTLKSQSTPWDSDEFYKSKFRPELKKKLTLQKLVSKFLAFFKILPSYND